MAHVATTLLSQDGYNVKFVSTAREALEILKSETPDVIIAEAEGGEISGKDLCAIVKTNERLQRIPVILVTESGRPSDYAAVHELGAVVCMSKPCQPAKLLQAVHLVAPPPSEQSAYSAAFNMNSFVRTSS
jgi:CheY-like chemotaxis protein